MTEIRRRRALTNVGGDVDSFGDPESTEILAGALDVAPDESETAEDRAHVHGFHAYPARAHPVTARRLVEGFTEKGATVLDPFCGSGTILVEAMLAGRAAIGTDLNPIAVMLARSKTYPRTKEKTAALVAAAKGVSDFAEARRKAKAGATKRLPAEDVALFAPHVLLELDSLRAGIAKAPPETRPELSLVLSAILVKVSQKRGDTSEETAPKRLAAGFASRLFVQKAEDFAKRHDELAELLPSPPPKARVFEDDATRLAKVKDRTIDAVITSPPYVATYDYVAHHALRMRWLGLDPRVFASKEMGSRRTYGKLSVEDARAAWTAELEKLFRSLARVTKTGAPVVLLIADSALGTPPKPLRAAPIVEDAASRVKAFAPVARASQARPHFHAPTAAAFRDVPRAEHALLLRRV